jgi:hypothetical protein
MLACARWSRAWFGSSVIGHDVPDVERRVPALSRRRHSRFAQNCRRVLIALVGTAPHCLTDLAKRPLRAHPKGRPPLRR